MTGRNALWAALAGLGLLLTSACSAPEGHQEVLEAMGGDGVPGAVLLVQDDRAVEFSRAVGTMGPDDDRSLTMDTPFRIASTTKPMTAVVILRLAEQGRLDLDDPIGLHLPASLVDRLHVLDGRSYGDRITVRMLLGHTSGITDRVTDEFVGEALADPTRRWTPEELVRWTIDHLEPEFEPGTGFAYADDGYVLLGLIAESASGRPLVELYRTMIFDPLGLEATYLEGHEPGRGDLARSMIGDADATDHDPSFDWGGGGGWSRRPGIWPRSSPPSSTASCSTIRRPWTRC
jgi:D-alanyl-D-alanine carboxypeptidase